MVDLADQIDWSACEVLNAAGSNSLQNIIKEGYRDQEGLLLESDADEQLLITIAFKSLVKIESIRVDAPGDGRAPSSVKLLVNKRTLGFEDAESLPGEQVLEISPDDLGQRLELKLVKFQNVERLSIFVPANQDDCETSALTGLKLWGAAIFTTNIKDVRAAHIEPGSATPRALPHSLSPMSPLPAAVQASQR